MVHLVPGLRTGLVLGCLVVALGLLAVRGEAGSALCREYETTVLLEPNRPVKATGKACQKGGRWYLVNFGPGALGR